MRATRCFGPKQNASPSILLSLCSARYHEQVKPCARFTLAGRPRRECTTAAPVPFVMSTTDFVRDEVCTPLPIWMTPPETLTLVLDPQPAVTATKSSARRTAERFMTRRYTPPSTSGVTHLSGVIPEHWPRLVRCRLRSRVPCVDRQQSENRGEHE